MLLKTIVMYHDLPHVVGQHPTLHSLDKTSCKAQTWTCTDLPQRRLCPDSPEKLTHIARLSLAWCFLGVASKRLSVGDMNRIGS